MHAPITIAVIDDEPAVTTLVEAVLEDEGYTVIIWTAGVGAHGLIRERMPAAVLLDMRMETAEAGMHVLRAVRHDPQTRAIPVILTSSRTQFGPEQTAELATLGALRLPKPFAPDALIEMIATALSLRETREIG
jgi:CheY-like chemotaxis protein